MTIETKAYGPLDITEEQIINFPFGIPGFDDMTQWALFEAKREPFYILQSLEKTEVAFFLLAPLFFDINYTAEVSENDLRLLHLLDPATECRIFIIVNIPRDNPSKLTGNLQAPLLFNMKEKIAGQCISTNPKWQLRHYLAGNTAVKEEN
jgi:flagellar assembly factor FliW